MSDDQTNQTVVADQTAAANQTSADPATTKQDPLAILESILQDAKNKSGSKPSPVAGSALPDEKPVEEAQLVDGEPPPTEEELAIIKAQIAQEEAERSAALEAQRQEQIAQQKALLAEELPQTPQYQARQQQVAEEQSQAQANTADGYDIKQLTKTKMQVQE